MLTIKEISNQMRKRIQQMLGSRHGNLKPTKAVVPESMTTIGQSLDLLLDRSDRFLVFVRFEQGDDLPDCQATFLADLSKMGWAVWIVDNSPRPLNKQWRESCGCQLYWHRANEGMCIGAYADAIAAMKRALRSRPEYTPPTLALVNNSFMPLLKPSANAILRRMFNESLPKNHFRGLTESREQAYHLQSYLLILGSDAWHSEVAEEFWRQCQDLRQREKIISNGEVTLTRTLLQAGLECEVMIPLSRLAAMSKDYVGIQDHHPVSPIEHNPYLVYWKELLQLTGIIKKSALNNASQSRTAGASLTEFLHVADQASIPGASAAIDRLVRY